MTAANIDYQGWAQLFVAILALLVAPPTISNFLLKRYYGVRAACAPLDQNLSGLARLWKVKLQNKSRIIGGFTVLIFPSEPNNVVKSFEFISPNDGGLLANPELSDGALEVRLERFARKRIIDLKVEFEWPDIPSIQSSDASILKKTIKRAPLNEEFVLSLMYHRMMLVLIIFAGVTFLIILRIFSGAFLDG